jgi:hypothetical protein
LANRTWFRFSIDYRTRPETGKFLRNRDQSFAQPVAADGCIYRMITTKDGADLDRVEHDHDRQFVSNRAYFAATAFAPVEREEQQRRFSRSHRAQHLLKPGYRRARSSGKAYNLATTLHQQTLDAIG